VRALDERAGQRQRLVLQQRDPDEALAERQLPGGGGDHDGRERGDAGRLGRAEPAGIDAADRKPEQQRQLPHGGDRNEALLAIQNDSADIVVTSLLGFLEKTIPKDALRAHRKSIHVGDMLDLEELRETLIDTGYDAVPVVEEPAQFAVRGSIVDLFDPAWEFPVRVELLDDDVVSMRTFDLDNQRSIDNIEAVTILPAASVPFDEESTSHLREYLAARSFDAKLIERIEEEVGHSHHSFLWQRYAPAMGLTGALLDYFQAPPVVVFADVAGQNASFRNIEKEFGRAAARDEEFPLLGLSDYIHDPSHFTGFDIPTIWEWKLAADSLAHEDEEKPDVFPAADTGEKTIRFVTTAHPSVQAKLDPLIGTIRNLRKKKTDVAIYSETPTQRDRLADMLEEDEELVHLPVGWITAGFIWQEAGIALLTDHQIFGRILPRPRRRRAKKRVQGVRAEMLQIGDFVVHVDYGIGRYTGLDKVGSGEGEEECLILRFHGGDRIFVPVDQMHLIEKYVGKESITPSLDRLGGTRWKKTKERARKAIEDIARDLLAVYAEREVAKGHAFGPDTPWQKELEASFPYEETPHQLSATAEIKEDMQSEHPMERLVCGDVGYGKTEVAIRVAFKAATEGKQVAVLVPTTLLAYQHFKTFKERMAKFPLRIEMLSRFVSAADQKKIVAGMHDGTVDIVIGTHRLLSKDIGFRNLGLLIVDEEHRFGVKHKEKLKRLTKTVDILSLTATPIPRTLYMSLSGLRKISVIDTPPHGRHPIKTEVVPFDEETIHRAITEEISRDGQVFFVHNRVRSIHSLQAFLERLLPGVRFGVGHGQMTEGELEKVMLAFTERKYDVLISTMIIESGLDFPNANTIIVNRADRFGLAQLYQLRGRVGRRERQAYAHFLVPRQMSMSDAASKRLQAMEEFEELGSGYRLAMRDLEIRGAGNVLGVEQHGHVAAIGFEMYCQMLKEAVDTMRAGEEHVEIVPCRIETPYECFLPVTYIDDADERMMIYKRLAGTAKTEVIDAIEEELVDRFGALPTPARYLLDLTRVKLLAGGLGVALVQIREKGFRSHIPEALQQAAEVPRELSSAPRSVPRASHGSNRLKRIAAQMGPVGGTSTLEFAPGKALSAEQCGRLVETFGGRLLFKSGKAFGINLQAKPDQAQLDDIKNLLQVAWFSNKINSLPDHPPSRGE